MPVRLGYVEVGGQVQRDPRVPLGGAPGGGVNGGGGGEGHAVGLADQM